MLFFFGCGGYGYRTLLFINHPRGHRGWIMLSQPEIRRLRGVFSAVVGSCLGSKSLNPSNCNYALPYTFLSIMIYTVIRWLFRSWCAFPFNNHQPWPPWWPPHAPSASRCPSRWWWDRSMAWGKSGEEWDSQNDGFSYWMIIIPNIIIYIYTYIRIYIRIYIYWLIGEYNPELLINQGFEHCSIELPSLPAKNIV